MGRSRMSSKEMAKNQMSTNHKKQIDTSYVFVKNRNIFDSINERIASKENGSTIILPHTCSRINFNVSGFANILSEKYPIAKENFHMLSRDAILGKTQFVEVAKNKDYNHSVIIANMICNNNNDHKHRAINYAALCYCMNSVKFKVKQLLNDNDIQRVEIHAPKFGTGSSGGNWKFISELIDDTWTNITTYIYSK